MSQERVTVTGLIYNSITCQNVMHFNNPDGIITPLAIANDIRDGFCTQWAVALVNTFKWINVAVQRIGSNTSPFNLPINVQGSDASDANACVPLICLKVRLHTATLGRKGRGRIYISGIRQSHWSAGLLATTQVANWTTRMGLAMNRYLPGGASGISLGVMPRNGGNFDFKPVDSLSLSLVPGVQRRRNSGVGI